MNRAPDSLAPRGLPRQQRRFIDRQLRQLMRRDVCSICGDKLKHNTRTFGGLDAQGNVVLAGECCTDQVTAIFVRGLYSDRKYDFLSPTSTDLTSEQIAAYQKAIADTAASRRTRRGSRKDQAGYTLIVLVRQVEPGNWFRTGICLNNKLLPVPNEEAIGHALFEIAAQREAVPPDRRTRNTLIALIEKYSTGSSQ